MWKGCRPQVGWVLPITVCTCVARLDCQYFGSSCLRGWKTAARCTEWPLAFASGIIADFTLTDCNYTRNKGKIVHIIYTDIHIHTDIKKKYIYVKKHCSLLISLLQCQLLLFTLTFVCWHRIGSRPMLIQDVGRNVQLHKCVLGSVGINTAPQIDAVSTSLLLNLYH